MDERTKVQVEKVQDLAGQISTCRAGPIDALVKRFKSDEGLKFSKVAKTGKVSAKMHEITGKGATEREALQNWANAARRIVLQVA